MPGAPGGGWEGVLGEGSPPLAVCPAGASFGLRWAECVSKEDLTQAKQVSAPEGTTSKFLRKLSLGEMLSKPLWYALSSHTHTHTFGGDEAPDACDALARHLEMTLAPVSRRTRHSTEPPGPQTVPSGAWRR